MINLKLLVTGVLFGASVAVSLPARAQVSGQYGGSNSDGFSVELIVFNRNGQPFLSLVRESALFYCDGKLLLTRGRPTAYGAAIVMEVPIKNGVVTFAGSSNDLSAMTGTVSFDGDNATGTLVSYASLFSGTATPPNDFEAKSCRTRNLHFRAKPVNPTH